MKSNNGWTITETRELFSKCQEAKEQGKSLSQAFEFMGSATGRTANSVRNYYYSQAKVFELVPEIAQSFGIKCPTVRRDSFKEFTDGEVRELVKAVLIGLAKGSSVRKTVYALASGNAKIALRLQNKYRSVLRTHKNWVTGVMAELSREGVEFVDPYMKNKKTDNIERLNEYIKGMDERKAAMFLSIIEGLS